MKLRVGFSTTNTLMSRLIRLFTNGPVSHTYVRFYDEFLKDEFVAHADFPGVLILQAEQFEKNNIIIEEFEITDEKLKDSLRRNFRLLGKKYDYWNIVGWAWVLAFKRWAKKKIENPIEDPNKLICVEFVVRILNDAQVAALPHGFYTPKTLREWFREVYKERNWERVKGDIND